MTRRTKVIIAIAVAVAGLAVLGTLVDDPPAPQVDRFSRDVYIRVVQQEYPAMTPMEATYLGAVACDTFDEGGSRQDARMAVAAEDGRTDRARYIVDAATTNLCDEYQDR